MNLIINNEKKAEVFINIFQNIKLFCDIFDIEINENEFYIQGMDNSHISIFEVKLNKDWFDTYEIDKNYVLGMNSNIFSKILQTWNVNHEIKLNMTQHDYLDISFEKISGDSEYNKYFQIPLVEINSERLNVPDQSYTLDLEFDSKKLKKLIDELSIFGEHVNLTANENEINAISKSVEGNMTVNIPFDDIEEYSIEENETINSTFLLKFIKNVCQFHKISQNINIYITNNLPIQLKYNICENSYTRFYIAPNVDDE